MFIGFILAITIAVFLTSSIVVLSGISGVLQESIITGGVIGVKSAVSYAIVGAMISLIVALFLILKLRKRHKTNP